VIHVFKEIKEIKERKEIKESLIMLSGYHFYKKRQQNRLLRQKGLNESALPFQPNKIDPLLKLLPLDEEVVNPWKF